jgi:hypothetical protein
MTCEHKRTLRFFAKHDDRAVLQVPHLNIEAEGYMPYVGVLGGDDTSLTICADCGQIIGWKPVTDEDLQDEEHGFKPR